MLSAIFNIKYATICLNMQKYAQNYAKIKWKVSIFHFKNMIYDYLS